MYCFEGRVRYSEIGRNGRLKLCSVIDYLQDCSTFQSEDIGVGVDYLKEHQVIWLMNSWQVQIKSLPSLAERIRVGTWAYDFEGFYGYRNFIIENMRGEHLVEANSIWVFYDQKKKRPKKVTEQEKNSYPMEPKLPMDYEERKIKIPDEQSAYEPFFVCQMQIDTNGHVNNGQYIRMAEEYLSDDQEVYEVRAEYRKSAIYGDIIYPTTARNENSMVVMLSDKNKNPYVVVEFRYKKRSID